MSREPLILTEMLQRQNSMQNSCRDLLIKNKVWSKVEQWAVGKRVRSPAQSEHHDPHPWQLDHWHLVVHMKVTEACYKHQGSLSQSTNACIPNMIMAARRHSCVLLICFLSCACMHARTHANRKDFNFGKHRKVSLNRKMSPSTGQSLNCLCCLALVTEENTCRTSIYMMHVEMPNRWCLTDWV